MYPFQAIVITCIFTQGRTFCDEPVCWNSYRSWTNKYWWSVL